MDERQKEALRQIAGLLVSKQVDDRRLAATMLGRIDLLPSRNMLYKLVQDPDRTVTEIALISLGHVGDAGSAPYLAAFYQSDVRSLRRAALVGTSQLVSRVPGLQEPLFAPLVTLLFDTDDDVRADATAVLAQLRDARALEPLLVALTDPVARVRANAIDALSHLDSSEAFDRMMGLMADEKDVLVRASAFEGLVRSVSQTGLARDITRQRRIVDLALASATDPNGDVRSGAIWALGHVDHHQLEKSEQDRILATLAAALDDPYEWSVRYALESLACVGTPEAQTLVEEFAERYTAQGEKDECIRKTLESALEAFSPTTL